MKDKRTLTVLTDEEMGKKVLAALKVGDKVRLAHFHGSTGDQILAESGATGVIKSIEEEPEPNVLTRCVEVQWNDGISWHFRHSLILENEE